ncbi:hypothetical protein ACIVBQ_000566 [Tenacibaculum discolor]
MEKTKDNVKKEPVKATSFIEAFIGTALVGALLSVETKRGKQEIWKQEKIRRLEGEIRRDNKIKLILGIILVLLYLYQVYIDKSAFFPIYLAGLIGGFFIGKYLAHIKLSKKQ